jgi:hypothetical protein
MGLKELRRGSKSVSKETHEIQTENQKLMATPMLDYFDHPAYSAFSRPSDRLSVNSLGGLLKVDEELSAIFNSPFLSREELTRLFAEKIRPELEVLRRIALDSLKEGDLYRPVLLKSLVDFETELFSEACFVNDGKKWQSASNLGAAGQKVLREMKQHGFSINRLNPEVKANLWHELKPYRMELEGRADARPQGMASCVIPLPQEGRKWKLFQYLLQESGIIEAATEYSRFPMELDYYAFQLSHEHETWWKNCYEDLRLPTAQATYMHYDQDFCLLKALLYFGEVTEKNGAFSIVPQCYRPSPSYAREVLLKRLDINTESVYLQDPGMKFPYYRKQFRSERYRKEFAKLPAFARGTSHFGDDLLDGSPLSEYLISKEKKVKSEEGDCTLFAGGKVIHRGGMVQEGRRFAIQVGFRMRDRSWNGLKSRIKRDLKRNMPEAANRLLRLTLGRKNA